MDRLIPACSPPTYATSPLEIAYLQNLCISGALEKDCVLTVGSQGLNKLESGAKCLNEVTKYLEDIAV